MHITMRIVGLVAVVILFLAVFVWQNYYLLYHMPESAYDSAGYFFGLEISLFIIGMMWLAG